MKQVRGGIQIDREMGERLRPVLLSLSLFLKCMVVPADAERMWM